MTRADAILIILVVLALPYLYMQLWSNDYQANYVLIHSSDNPPLTEMLTPHRTLQITGPLGDSIIEISDGRTRFVSSPCTSKACIHSGWLSRVGEFTACLPNRISLTLAGRHPDFDAINF